MGRNRRIGCVCGGGWGTVELEGPRGGSFQDSIITFN